MNDMHNFINTLLLPARISRVRKNLLECPLMLKIKEEQLLLQSFTDTSTHRSVVSKTSFKK